MNDGKSGRFDYVAYDEVSKERSEAAKRLVTNIETFINENLGQGRPQSIAMTKLEELFMWIGKAIRDKQVASGGDAAHQPARSNG